MSVGETVATCLIVAPFAVAIAYHVYMGCWGATGKHHLWPSDMDSPGQVWLHDGTWWTFTRLKAERVPRRFDLRSNPLDHELGFNIQPVPPRMRKAYYEQEYQ